MEHSNKFKRLASDILISIADEPKTFPEISLDCCIAQSKLRNYIGYLRKNRMIYIARWIKLETSQRPVAMYKAGNQDDEILVTRAYKKKGAEKPYKHSKWPRCDEAAAWMLNPIIKDQPCQI